MNGNLIFKTRQSMFLQVALTLCILLLIASNALGQKKVIEEQNPKDYKVGFTYQIPKNLPIEIRVRNLDKEDWVKEFEFEVKNISEKPIYYLSFSIGFVGAKNHMGDNLAFSVRFGRAKLSDIANEKANSEDPSIDPGKSHTFRISREWIEEWKKLKARRGVTDPHLVELFFSFLSFGDLTGYRGSAGTYISASPPIQNLFEGFRLNFNNKESIYEPCNEKVNEKAVKNQQPFSYEQNSSSKSLEDSRFCCQGGGMGCVFVKPVEIDCAYCDYGWTGERIITTFESNANSQCNAPGYECLDVNSGWEPFLCADFGCLHWKTQISCGAPVCDEDRDGYRAISCGGNDCNDKQLSKSNEIFSV